MNAVMDRIGSLNTNSNTNQIQSPDLPTTTNVTSPNE